MKKTNLLSTMTALAVLLLTYLPSKATVWRVNNNGTSYSTGVNVFPDLAQAINDNSVLPTDTLHVEASPTVYNTTAIHLTKRLVIIGPGYLFGGTTGNSNLQANHNIAKIGIFYFDAGSENSVYMGITQVGQLFVRTNNITIKRNNFIDDFVMNYPGTISNLLFTQNYFSNQEFIQTYVSTVNSSLITNNCFIGTSSFLLDGNFQGAVAQNVFDNNNPIDFDGVPFYNNIIKTGTLVAHTNDTNNIHNNVFTFAPPAFLPTPNSNTFSIPPGNLFLTGCSTDANLHINPACTQCLNNGSFGYEMGIYGGTPGTEYKLSGIPEIPAIYQLYATPNINRGDTIQVTIHTRSNN